MIIQVKAVKSDKVRRGVSFSCWSFVITDFTSHTTLRSYQVQYPCL